MHILNFVLGLGIILLATKVAGLLFRKIGLPQVLGYIIAGIIIGPAIFGDLFGWSLIDNGNNLYGGLVNFSSSDGSVDALGIFSKIGVLIIMFISGIETDLGELKKTGVISTVIACVGVAVPMASGFLICLPFALTGVLNTDEFTFGIMNALFIGTILTATSVALTVSVLRELGKFKSRVGTILLSAAIIDDIIGIVVLSIVVGVSGGDNGGGGMLMNAIMDAGAPVALKPLFVIILVIAFFALAIGGGIGASKLFKYFDKKWPKTHRIPIFALAFCFGYAFIAEEIFGVADISGAFLAGLFLSSNPRNASYVDDKLETSSYLIFAPVFFASIGINMNLIGGLTSGWMILFVVAVVLVGILGKIVGCGLTAACFKMGKRDSLIVGAGMMSRGEVALIVTMTGIHSGLLDSSFSVAAVMLILVTAVLTPIMLKLLFSKQSSAEAVLATGQPIVDEVIPEHVHESTHDRRVKMFMGADALTSAQAKEAELSNSEQSESVASPFDVNAEN